ncbi:MAG: PAS domain S-box protein, partial [Gemmatimonadota bacterium]
GTGHVVGLVEDISDQHAAEEALRESERQYRSLFEFSADAVFVAGPDGEILAANPAACRMLDRTEEELKSLGRAGIVDATDPALATMLGERDRAGMYRGELTFLRRDGSRLICDVTTFLHPDSEGRMRSSTIARDVTARRAAEQELQRTTQVLRTLIDAAPLAIYALDLEGRIRSWNPAAERMFGWSAAEAVGQPLPIIPPEAVPEFHERIRRVAAGESISAVEVRRCRRDGQAIDLRLWAAPTRAPDGRIDGIIAINEDATERKALAEQLRHAQKMEAIGLLTGGIAHDFNNLLTIIITNAGLVADRVAPEQTEMRIEIAELQRAATRGAELVRKLMAFSRRRDLELRPLNLVDVIRDTERTLRHLLPEPVEISVHVDESRPLLINGDAGAIDQILLNLATNARDAMPDGGILRVDLRRARLDDAHRRIRGWGDPGEYVVVEVSDTGSGMSPEILARIFEPFFTTKEMGKGTGLGMAMVYGLMKQHRGFIDVDSEPGHGTTIRLYFPAVTDAIHTHPGGSEDAAIRGGIERILVVDDEDGIRRSAARVLGRFGYTVVEASDGSSALKVIERTEVPFDLVITDLVMPHMGGLALHNELRARGHRTRVLLMSGYTAEDMRAMSDAGAEVSFLRKPWTITDLLRRVRAVLDEPPAGSGEG